MHASPFIPIHRPTPLPRNIKPVAKAKAAPAGRGKHKDEKPKAKGVDPPRVEKAPKPKRNSNETPGGEDKPDKPKKRSRASKN
jgi:hypothetical protein